MNRETLILDRFDGSEVTDAMLQQASILFNEHYGVWSRDPMNHQTVPKPGECPASDVDADVPTTDDITRQPCQDEPTATPSPVPPRRRRMPLRNGHDRGSTRRQRVRLPMEGAKQGRELDHSTRCTHQVSKTQPRSQPA